MATFDEVLSANRRDSLLLLVLLVILLASLGAAAAHLLIGDYVLETSAVTIAVTALYFFAMWFYGDAMVLTSVGAEHVNSRNYPMLDNVLEELCIATNLPKPEIYVIHDPSLNAFATGRDPEHASVAITSGLLEKLNREELMAVMAHEISHVKNLDIRFSTLLAVTVGAILVIRDLILNSAFRLSGRRGGRSSGKGSGGMFLYAVCLVFIILAPLFTVLLHTMASRSREYMADTNAVKITRNPQSMISALTKVSQGPSAMLSDVASGTQHIFFANPMRINGRERSSLFSTHPLLEERIASIKKIYGIR